MKLTSKKMKLTARKMMRLFKIFVPYLGAGIKVTYISKDWSELEVQMKLSWYNLNAFETHFGGSLYAMTDPHFALLLMQRIGHDYYVWDKSASIDFVKPGLGIVKARFTLSQPEVDQVIADAASGKPCYPEFDVEVQDEKGAVVARVHKILYVKKKNGK